MSWKDRFQTWHEDERNSRLAVDPKKASERKQREDKEYENKLEKLQKQFQCHIRGCGAVATGPGSTPYDGDVMGGGQKDDWSRPRGVGRCTYCEKWTCPNHLTDIIGSLGVASGRKICQDCAIKAESGKLEVYAG